MIRALIAKTDAGEAAVGVVASWIIAFLFLRSSILHINNPYLFLANIYGYKFATPLLSQFAAMFLPSLMLTLAFCLLTGVFRGSALAVGTILLIVFSAAQLSVIFRGLDISCGCFSNSEARSVNFESLTSTLFWVFVGLVGCVFERRAYIAGSGSEGGVRRKS